MTDLSRLPPLHPERVKSAVSVLNADLGGQTVELGVHQRGVETALKALEVVQKLQSGFGFAPDLYDKVEMAKATVEQGRTVFGAIKALMKK